MLFVPVPTPSPSAVVSPSSALTDVTPSLPTSPVPTPSSTGLIDAITLGSWPDWIAAVGTSAAFIVAAVSYWRSVQMRREEQARLVYSKLVGLKFHDTGTVFESTHDGVIDAAAATFMGSNKLRALVPVIQLTAAIHNGSKELIGPARLQVVNTGRKTTYDTFSIRTGAVDPESEEVFDFVWPNADHPGQPALGTTLLFRDASGRWWRRHLAEPIELVHDDPENYRATPAEHAQWAANARALWGREPSPSPKVPMRARWHRFWRERRGKSPIP